MKTRYIAITFFIMLLMILSGCTNAIEDYPSAVKWNDTIYLGAGDFISDDKAGNKIGSISKNVSKFPTKNGESNEYPAGSNIFEVKGLSTTEAIAIEYNGQYRVFNKEK